jgi:PHD/YefM family antitoxin component YafN of YafNO toxin-antitoxin module
MGLSFEHSILPMSDLRANLDKIKKQLSKTPIIITNKGRPDFGLCDLDTLAIAVHIHDIKKLLKSRIAQRRSFKVAQEVFSALDEKYGA